MFENFVTWEIIASFGGAVGMTALVTQSIKDVKWFANIPTRLVSFVVALFIIALATYFTSCLTIDVIAILPFNALIVSLASNGAFEGLVYMVDKTQDKDTARFDEE